MVVRKYLGIWLISFKYISLLMIIKALNWAQVVFDILGAYDVAVILWVTSYNEKCMTKCYITLWKKTTCP